MDMEINFPGGKQVTSTYNGFTVTTDLPKNEGGDGTAPAPFDLFLASIGTCAGVFVVFFCDSRKIPTRTQFREKGLSFIKIGQELGIGRERARQIVRKHRRHMKAMEDPFALKIMELRRLGDSTKILSP